MRRADAGRPGRGIVRPADAGRPGRAAGAVVRLPEAGAVLRLTETSLAGPVVRAPDGSGAGGRSRTVRDVRTRYGHPAGSATGTGTPGSGPVNPLGAVV
ncbi:hypothetical protein MicB006_1937 [Micromonospora sp. B006]|nr:hypothetical protein MicB006_1937 [Micromonospora sp. B006]